MKICLWSDSTFITRIVYFEMPWNEKCLDPNHLHDALKPPVARRLCANDFFGEVKCLGGSTVLLKNFVCNVIAPDGPYPLGASESPRSEDTSPSMQNQGATVTHGQTDSWQDRTLVQVCLTSILNCNNQCNAASSRFHSLSKLAHDYQ